jgi:heat shock protein HtpX
MATFHSLIARNKRNSALLIAGFVLFFVVVGGLIGYSIGGLIAPSPSDDSISVYRRGVDSPPPAAHEAHDYAMRVGAIVAGGAAVLAGLLTLLSYYGGSSAILKMSGAQPLAKDDDPQLFNVVEEMAIAAGVPMPKVYLIHDSAPNAFATGRDPRHAVLAITTGLRSKLTRDELQGVMAHELSHVRHYDMLFAMLMAVMVGVLVMLCDAFLRSLRHGALVSRGSRRSKGGNPAVIVVLVVAIVLAILAPILSRIIQMALSRQREYLADAGAVELTRNPTALAGALSRIASDAEVLEVANRATAGLYIVHPIKKFEDRSSSIFDTHPPVRDRIARLLSLGQ